MGWIRLCGEDEVAEGSVVSADVGGRHLMAVRLGGQVRVADGTCTHEDADLSCGFVSPEGVRCPLHLSVFDMASGMPLNPPAQDPIMTYNVKIEHGTVLVEI
jgi:nitrite reductase/ring-hydroxylating ferredoxin subunit